jgi:hypothetical protein
MEPLIICEYTEKFPSLEFWDKGIICGSSGIAEEACHDLTITITHHYKNDAITVWQVPH